MKKLINLFLTIIVVIFSALFIVWILSDFSNTKEIIEIFKKTFLVTVVMFIGVSVINLFSKR